MKNSQFHELFVHELKDIYWAENHLAKELKKMSKSATSEKLSNAIEKHQEETENQIKRLEKVFEIIDVKASGKKCDAMEGLLEEAQEILKSTKEDTMVRDAGIIIACQKVEHYEIASYGSLVHLAKQMGSDECAKILSETLEEEKKTDALLTEIAESEVNEMAVKE
ncbi:ferritin-like domain-containing protein [Marivirga sp. S37H4]|uniref:Ferritin-like domain-containing protein n=2 Tax=Marivirga aurantiaca TaxID=2802615 RepID=A0A934WW03_9BACT|nr:ferritin-like domain-containing protein [Marivirga aurantiaca]